MKNGQALERLSVTAALIFRKVGSETVALITEREPGGVWEFPGGKQEPGETLEACLSREIHEELGLQITVNRRMMSVHYTHPAKSIVLHAFVCQITGGVASALGCKSFAWVRPAVLRRYNLLPPDRIIAEKLMGDCC